MKLRKYRGKKVYVKPVTVYVTESVKTELMKIAYEYRSSVSEVIRLSIDQYLKNNPVKNNGIIV